MVFQLLGTNKPEEEKRNQQLLQIQGHARDHAIPGAGGYISKAKGSASTPLGYLGTTKLSIQTDVHEFIRSKE